MTQRPHDHSSVFHWNTGQPSIFSRDPAFTPRTAGKTTSQIASEAVSRHVAATGRSPGTLTGLSAKSDAAAEAYAAARSSMKRMRTA